MTLSAKARARLTLGLCTGLSIGLHAAALALALRNAPPQVLAAAAAPVLQGRLVPLTAPATTAAPPAAMDAPRATKAQPAKKPPAPPPQRPGTDRPATPAPSAYGGDEAGYLPRPLLTLAPMLIAPVEIPEPAGAPADAMGARVGIVAVFIDETGRVRDVQPQDPRLPPEYEEAVRQAFMAARYLAGQRDGRVVKSRIRIEVVFGEQPAAPQP
ncbi:MAG: hypothetical protein QM740_07590 [Acidovorax sp.]